MEDNNFDSLISLGDFSMNQSDYRFDLKLNPNHEIFKGHFPEKAILPGVVMVEILKRATQNIVGKTLTMKTAKNIKFLK